MYGWFIFAYGLSGSGKFELDSRELSILYLTEIYHYAPKSHLEESLPNYNSYPIDQMEQALEIVSDDRKIGAACDWINAYIDSVKQLYRSRNEANQKIASMLETSTFSTIYQSKILSALKSK